MFQPPQTLFRRHLFRLKIPVIRRKGIKEFQIQRQRFEFKKFFLLRYGVFQVFYLSAQIQVVVFQNHVTFFDARLRKAVDLADESGYLVFQYDPFASPDIPDPVDHLAFLRRFQHFLIRRIAAAADDRRKKRRYCRQQQKQYSLFH